MPFSTLRAGVASGNALVDKVGGGFNDLEMEATGEESIKTGFGFSILRGVDTGSYTNW